MEHDPEIRDLIRGWTPPAPAPALDERMARRYNARHRSRWHRRLELQLSIPAPLIAAALLLAIFLGGALYRSRPPRELIGGMQPIPEPVLTVIAEEGNR
jgi:hypothetical protein